MRYESRQAMVDDIRAEHDALCARLAEIPKGRHREPGVWGEGWSVTDLVAHLAEWHLLFLTWYEEGQKGATPQLPAPGYKWSELPRLNRDIWQRHRTRSMAQVRHDFDSGYDRILAIVERLSEKQLMSPGQFAWTGRNPLRTYLGGTTSSHYRFAMKVLKRWLGGATRRPLAASSGKRTKLAARRMPGTTPARPMKSG